MSRTTNGTGRPLVRPNSTSMTRSSSTGTAKNLVKRLATFALSASLPNRDLHAASRGDRGRSQFAKEGLDVAFEFFGEAFAAGVLRFGMESAGCGAEFVHFESVGAGGAVEQEAGEVGDFRALVRGKRFA